MAIASSTDGSPTSTGWKRRSSAASFSMCLRYSSSVVAPTARSSPRASIGLSRLAASTAPSAAPAPTMVCSSSMKRMTVPPASLISLRTAFRRSSNSPRYFEPASRAPMSSATTRRSRSDSGTSPDSMRWARPSTIAVLPTPGSPMRTGLFFVRRLRTWMTRRISSSRPMTGSSLPCSASSVRSRPNFSSAWYLSSADWSVTRWGPRTSPIALSRFSLLAPPARSASPASEGWAARASSRCSVETYSSLRRRISSSPSRRTRTSSLDGPAASPPAVSVGIASSRALTAPRSAPASAPSLASTGTTTPPSCSSSTPSRCSGVTCGLWRRSASWPAAAMASWALMVNRSACIRNLSRGDADCSASLARACAHAPAGYASAHERRDGKARPAPRRRGRRAAGPDDARRRDRPRRHPRGARRGLAPRPPSGSSRPPDGRGTRRRRGRDDARQRLSLGLLGGWRRRATQTASPRQGGPALVVGPARAWSIGVAGQHLSTTVLTFGARSRKSQRPSRKPPSRRMTANGRGATGPLPLGDAVSAAQRHKRHADEGARLGLALDADRAHAGTRVGGADEVRLLIGHELGLEGLAHALDFGLHLGAHLGRAALEGLEAAAGALELLLELEDALDPGQVEPELGGHGLDAAQALDVGLRVQPRALGRALGLDEAAGLIHAQRLRVHLGQLGGDRDHEHAALLLDDDARGGAAPHEKSLARGLPFMTCDSFSTASDCSSLRLAGTSMTKR